MSLVEAFHAEHKARLQRMGGFVKPAPAPVVEAPKPAVSKPAPAIDKSYYPQMWFWELVSFTPRFPNRSITFDPCTPRVEYIQRIVCKSYGISRNDLLSQRRTACVVRPRQVAVYISKVMTPQSLPEIGRRFGNRDHTTILSSVRKIEWLIKTDHILAARIEDLKAEVLA